MIRAKGAGVLLVALLMADCSSSSSDGVAGPTVTSESTTAPTLAPTTTSTTLPADPFAVPDPITLEYLDRVMVVINHVRGDALREIAEKRDLPESALNKARAVMEGTTRDVNLRGYSELLVTQFRGVKLPPGDLVTRADRIADSTSKCVVFLAHDDASALSSDPSSALGTVVYVLAEPSSADRSLNPTPWVLVFDGPEQGGVTCASHP